MRLSSMDPLALFSVDADDMSHHGSQPSALLSLLCDEVTIMSFPQKGLEDDLSSSGGEHMFTSGSFSEFIMSRVESKLVSKT